MIKAKAKQWRSLEEVQICSLPSRTGGGGNVKPCCLSSTPEITRRTQRWESSHVETEVRYSNELLL